jgi:hypothetical protein
MRGGHSFTDWLRSTRTSEVCLRLEAAGAARRSCLKNRGRTLERGWINVTVNTAGPGHPRPG